MSLLVNDEQPYSDGSALAAQFLTLAPNFASQTFFVFDVRNYQNALNNLNTSSAELRLLIGLDIDTLWLFLHYRDPDAACFSCAQSWMQNNQRQSGRWFAAKNDGDLTRRGFKCLLPSTLAAVQGMVQAELERPIATHNDTPLQHLTKIQLDTLNCSRHIVLPNPECARCGLPDDSAKDAMLSFSAQIKPHAEDDRVANPSVFADHLRQVYVDNQTGLISHHFHSINSDVMPMFASESKVYGSPKVELGYGRAGNHETCRKISILETLERFANQRPRSVNGLTRDCYQNLEHEAIDPALFFLHDHKLCAHENFQLIPYQPKLECDWKWSWSSRSQRPMLVPAQLVYYWLDPPRHRPQHRFIYETTSGAALGGNIEEATYFGLLELIERDAYLTTWYGQITPRLIALESLKDVTNQALVKKAQRQGLEIYLFDIRLDINIPVIWAMVVDPRPDAPVKSYCASGSVFDAEKAVHSALIEVLTSIGVYQKDALTWRTEARAMFEDDFAVKEMHDHVVLHTLPESLERFDFLFQDMTYYTLDELFERRPSPTRDINLTAELEVLIDCVLNVAEDVLITDISTRALKYANLSCVKVLAPGLHPVTFGHQYRRTSLARTNSARQARGLPELVSAAALNQRPHNFP